jgi:hypothetical protein
VARWSPFEVRYAMPLMVPWAALIAVALARGARWITRIVLILLVLACLPQLLDNVQQPLVPPIDYHGSYLAPYFPSHQVAAGNPMASDYQTVTTVLTQSTCTKASLGNWVLIEYPLWVGLQHQHWTGVLNDFNVHNDSSKLEPHYRPCATITQQQPTYRTPDNGTVNVQQGGLAISVNADDAATVTTPIRGWGSQVSGVRVLPGGGWTMARLLWFPLLAEHGSAYVFSRSARTVQLQLSRDPAAPRYSITVTGPDGGEVPAVEGPHSYHADIEVHAGTNRISLAVSGLPTKGRLLQALLYAVTIAPATP